MSVIIAAIIAQLVGVLGPILLKWLQSLFNRVAPSVASGTAEDLVQAAHDATPRRQVLKRALLRRIKDHAAKLSVGEPLSKADTVELTVLAFKTQWTN